MQSPTSESLSSPHRVQPAPAPLCPSCDQRARRQAGSGRFVSYRTIPALAIPVDLLLPWCSRCKRLVLDEHAQGVLAQVLPALFEAELRKRARSLIDAITRYTSQRKLEELLGLSQGYISRLRAGDGNPSPQLVSELAIIGVDPLRRLAELTAYWAQAEWVEDPRQGRGGL